MEFEYMDKRNMGEKEIGKWEVLGRKNEENN